MALPEALYLGLGSNSGDSRAILSGAIADIRRAFGPLEASAIYRSLPRYVLDQEDFLNCVVKLAIPELSPEGILEGCQRIEAAWGRDRARERPKGERRLDIDILLIGPHILDLPSLHLPHPGIVERKFVLLPLLELDPELDSPLDSRPYMERLDSLPQQGVYFSSLGEYASIGSE